VWNVERIEDDIFKRGTPGPLLEFNFDEFKRLDVATESESRLELADKELDVTDSSLSESSPYRSQHTWKSHLRGFKIVIKIKHTVSRASKRSTSSSKSPINLNPGGIISLLLLLALCLPEVTFLSALPVLHESTDSPGSILIAVLAILSRGFSILGKSSLKPDFGRPTDIFES